MVDKQSIVITGAAGFIGSCMVAYFNECGIDNLVLVDDFADIKKTSNLLSKRYQMKVHRDQLEEWIDNHSDTIDCIIHLGARTDTTTQDKKTLKKLNTDYSISIFKQCAQYGIALIYASSAATYGDGSLGYEDNENTIPLLRPLNEYARSKQEFDEWVLKQDDLPPYWIGLKFFNVYGPNEYHKGRMASVVYHAYRNVLERGKVTLFRSHKEGIADGEQKRDFIYVRDVVQVIYWLWKERTAPSGIYNLGTGEARTFLDLVHALYDAINHQPNITFVDTPEDIRDKYQYFTEATMTKLINAGYNQPFYTLEEGIRDYAVKYLQAEKAW